MTYAKWLLDHPTAEPTRELDPCDRVRLLAAEMGIKL